MQTPQIPLMSQGFSLVIQAEDFMHFRNQLQAEFADPAVNQRFSEFFSSWLAYNGSLSALNALRPIFTPSRYDEGGYVVMDGMYPTTPPITFRLRYRESDKGNLYAITLRAA